MHDYVFSCFTGPVFVCQTGLQAVNTGLNINWSLPVQPHPTLLSPFSLSTPPAPATPQQSQTDGSGAGRPLVNLEAKVPGTNPNSEYFPPKVLSKGRINF